MKILTFYASERAKLDSNVHSGGGTDDTQALQAILDIADENTGVRLIMDGAALVSSLQVSSNTTIECLSKDCGFYQIDQTNKAIVTNKNWCLKGRPTKNVSLIGGSYNQNCLNQIHHSMSTDEERVYTMSAWRCTFALEFYGIENFLMRDVTVIDFRTYAFMMTNFKNCTIEDTWLELNHHMEGNQDGFHFWGPGQYLTVRNVGGRVGDDFMNIGPDEGDLESSITDVLVDGVFLDEADQAIRLLTRKNGLLDRVTIRNVQGSYKSFGFYIDPWFSDSPGNFGDLFFENINLKQMPPNYFYHKPILFSIGGDIRCLTLQNIRHEYPDDNRSIAEIGIHSPESSNFESAKFTKPDGTRPKIQNLIIDGLTIIENGDSKDMVAFDVYGEVGNMIVKSVLAVKDDGVETSGTLIKLQDCSNVDNLILTDSVVRGMEKVVDGEKNAKFTKIENCTGVRG